MRIVLAVVLVASPGFAPPADIYVQPGLEVGGDGANDGVFVAPTIEAGYRVRGAWWLHTEALAGPSETGNFSWGGQSDAGSIRQFRIGGEWRHSWLVLGIDVGSSHETMNGQPELGYAGGMFAVRAGVDFGLGVDHLRIRSGFEMFGGGKRRGEPAIGGKDYQGGGVTVALAVVW